MVRKNDNIAYDFSLFDAEKQEEERLPEKEKISRDRKKNNVLKIEKEQLYKNRRKKYSPLQITTAIIVSLTVLTIVTIMISSQVYIAELTEQISTTQVELAEKQSEYTQLSMRVESELSLNQVNDYATNVLGMAPTEDYQIQYINIGVGDTGEVVHNSGSWFNNVKSALSAWMS